MDHGSSLRAWLPPHQYAPVGGSLWHLDPSRAAPPPVRLPWDDLGPRRDGGRHRDSPLLSAAPPSSRRQGCSCRKIKWCWSRPALGRSRGISLGQDAASALLRENSPMTIRPPWQSCSATYISCIPPFPWQSNTGNEASQLPRLRNVVRGADSPGYSPIIGR